MAEPTETLTESYRWGAGLAVVLYLLRWLLPRGYRFRWIRLYAERDDQPQTLPEEADDETQ